MDARTAALWRRYAAILPPLDTYPLQSSRFRAGETLAGAGEPITRLCFVVEGLATVHNVMENGRAVLLREYSGVQTVGELELLMDYPVHASAVKATTAGAMLLIPLTPAVRAQVYADAVLLRHLGQIVARKLERSNRIASQDRLYPVAARLAAFLLYAQRNRQADLHLTRLSELLGTSYRHVLRTVRAFVDKGWLAHNAQGYQVLDAAALMRLAGEIRYD
ncbi:MAG: cyclic nucleotide-binding domain-containing protein [Candidatus Limiplasma sp.]|nr:cyclic nucleotide-binding domain-containing protein [Candidatus Limiplasma sp.]MEA5144445.1 cyclic nucleotide-binding domain-containing protein [Candidatus Limiplasma sp.]